MSKLKAKDPATAEPSKPKALISGPTGVGKTWFGLSFPRVYYFAHEDGASRGHYTDRLKAGGGAYFGAEDGALDPDEVITQVIGLATEKHGYQTALFDSITKLFQTIQANEAERMVNKGQVDAFGASKKPAVAFMRRLISWIDKLDMNVIFIAHESAEWGVSPKTGERSQIGVTADVWDKLPYELDLWLQCSKRGPQRTAKVRKSRLLGFPEADEFDLDYAAFAQRYGKDIIEKASTQIAIASEGQIKELVRLLDLVKIPEEETQKWLTKAKASDWSEMTQTQISKCIDHLKSKLK